MPRIICAVALLVCLSLFVCCRHGFAVEPQLAGDLYVATDGDDMQPGTRDQPVRTLAKAQQIVRQRLKAAADRDVTVMIGGGTYYLQQPLVFTPEDGASPGHHVTYAAAKGEQVVISGGRAVTAWQRIDKRWQATLPDVRAGTWYFRELFAGDRRLTRARTPNDGYLRVDQAGPDNRTSFVFRADDLKPWKNLEQAELVFLHDWSTSRVGIASIDQQQRLVRLDDPIGCSAPHYRISHFEPHPRYFVENVPDLVDQAGEWYLDGRTGALAYLPREGESPETTTLIAPRLDSLIVVQGDAQHNRPVQGLRFAELTFMHCRWSLPAGGYAAGQACMHENRDGSAEPPKRVMMPAAVTFDLAERCKMEKCRLAHLGGCGIHLRRTCRNNEISDCIVEDVAGNGIMIGEMFTRRSTGEGTGNGETDLVSRGNAILRNTVKDCGKVFFGAVGIWVGIAADTHVAQNEVHDLPYTGISVGWSWNTQPTGCRGNVVEHNHIHDVVQMLSDGGGIYTLGHQPGTVLRGNRIHDVLPNAGRAESNGIFMDEGSDQILVEGNTIYRIAKSPIRFHQAEHLTLRANRIACHKGVPTFRYNNATPDTMVFEQNEIVENEAGDFP